MDKTVKKIFIFLMISLFASGAFADWNNDYEGTLGNKKIGLTIITKGISWDSNTEYDSSKIISIHYYYKKGLKDISLKIKSFNAQDIILEEYSKDGKIIGIFKLSFATQSSNDFFSSIDKINKKIIIGEWMSIDGKKKIPIYLKYFQSVTATKDGGRCYDNYYVTEERIKEFYLAVINNDEEALQEKFYSPSLSKETRDQIAQSTPHNLFCNEQGVMLGNGIVWFDNEGNIIRINTPDRDYDTP